MQDFNLGVIGSFFNAFTHLYLLNALIDDDESSLNFILQRTLNRKYM
jgi:hypothetical protein